MTIVTKNGRHYASIEVEPGPDGKRRRKSLGGFATRREAEDAMAKARVERREGTLVPSNRTTYAEWASIREEVQRSEVRARSVAIYARQRRVHLTPVIGHCQLQRITAIQFRKATTPPGLSLRNQRSLHGLLKADLQAAVEQGILATNPGARVRPPSKKLAEEQAPKMMPYSSEEAAEVLSRIEGSRYATFIDLSGSLGWRRAEGLGVTWDRVALGEGTLVIDRAWNRDGWGPTKTGKVRTLELDDHSLALLKAWKRRRREEELRLGRPLDERQHVFCHEDGRPWQPDTVSHAWAALQTWTDIPKRRLHDWRHTAASLALKAGENPVAVAEMLGHDVQTLLAIYGHTFVGDKRKVATTVSNAIHKPRSAV